MPAHHAWHNPIPPAITMTPAYQKMPPSVRHTLQGIADRCDRPRADGSLIGAFGGDDLVKSLGINRSTFWRHVARLTQAGLLVVLSRGGTFEGRSLANCYGIPAAPGALDHRRAARRMQRMARGDDGKLRPQVINPGAQVMLWTGQEKKAGGHSDNFVRNKCDYPRVKVRRGSSQSETVPSPVPSPNDKNHGGLARRHFPKRSGEAGRFAGGGIGRVSRADLCDTDRLLGLFRKAVGVGWLAGGDRDRLRCVSAAEHALRCARDKDNPGRLFVALVRCPLLIDSYISEQDEIRAVRRLSEQGRSAFAAGQRPDTQADPQTGVQPDPPALSEDARLVLGAIVEVKRRGLAVDPIAVVRSSRDGSDWTRRRWDRAVRQLIECDRLPAGVMP